ncbi:MAG: ABC transporter permease [Anaerolineae bacterium]|nr:ABC transporter permease [Anaerolineae bacterium]
MNGLVQRLQLGNWPLGAGGLAVALLVAMSLAPGRFAAGEPVQPLFVQAGGQFVTRPQPPGTLGYVLGSDIYGRDVWAQLVYGSRYTLGFCLVAATLRVVIGMALGLWAGWFGGWSDTVTAALAAAFSAVPALILAWGPLSLANSVLDFNGSLVVWTLILAVLGWGETLTVVRAWTTTLQRRLFVEAARVNGQTEWGILTRHIWPHLRGLVLIQIAFEMSAILLTIAELGYFSVFLGGGIFDDVLGRTVNLLPEWGGMIAGGRNAFLTYPWLTFVPLAGFVVAIVGFNLLAEGLRRARDQALG